MLPQIVKRDGTKEVFSLMNIAKVATATGLTADQAKTLAETMSHWAEGLNVPEITSIQVRDKMQEELPKLSQSAADLYTWYQQSKENG